MYPKWWFWTRLEKDHPIIYEAVQWGALIMACGSRVCCVSTVELQQRR